MGLFHHGRRRLRDEPPYWTLNCAAEGLTGRASLPGRRRLRDESPYGTEALTGRASLRDGTEALTGRASCGTEVRRPLRDGLLMGLLTTARRDLRAALTRRLSLRDSSYGTTGRRSLRDEPPYGTFNCGAEGLTGRRDGGAYGTSPYGTRIITGRRHLRDEHPYGTLNCGAEGLTGRRRLRDDSPYVIMGRRRLRDEPPYGTGRRRCGTSLHTGLLRDGRGTFRQLRRPSL